MCALLAVGVGCNAPMEKIAGRARRGDDSGFVDMTPVYTPYPARDVNVFHHLALHTRSSGSATRWSRTWLSILTRQSD